MFRQLEQLKQATLTRFMLDPTLLGSKKTMPLSQNLAAGLILLTPVIVFWLLPRMGVSPGFLHKILLMLVLWIVFMYLMTLLDKPLKKKYALKFEEAADYFVRTALNGLEEPTPALAEIMVWCEAHGTEFFYGIIRRHSRRFALEKRLNPKDLASCEERLREIVALEREERKALHQEKLANIKQIRESLRSGLYRSSAHMGQDDKEKYRAELQPVADELSVFQLLIPRGEQGNNKRPACVSGNLHLAVSPDHIIFLESNPLSVSMSPDPVSFLLNNTHSNLYILPASFIKELEIDSFGERLRLVLQAPLPGIVMAHFWSGTNPKNHKQLIQKSWREPLRNLSMHLDIEQKTSLSKNLKALVEKVSSLPECPICQEFSAIQPTGEKKDHSGFRCDSCKTHFSWGVDTLRRVTLFPAPENQKGVLFQELR